MKVAVRPEERLARELLARALQVPVERYDDGTQSGMHDLDILWPDKEPTAVEVVGWASQDHLRDEAAWQKHASDFFPSPQLTQRWMVVSEASAGGRMRDVQSRAVTPLSVLERRAISSFRPGDAYGHGEIA